MVPAALRVKTELHDDGVVIPTAFGSVIVTTINEVAETSVVVAGVVMLIETLDPTEVPLPHENKKMEAATHARRKVVFIIPPVIHSPVAR